MNIVLIGAGGIGTHVMQQLIHQISDDDMIVVIDGDVFEEKNLDRQIFPEDKIGQRKALVVADMYGVLGVDKYVESERDLMRFVPDIIICCPDNNEARKIAVDYCMDNTECSCIVAGNESMSASAIYYNHGLYGDTPTHPLSLFGYNLNKKEDKQERVVISCAEARQTAPQTIVANSMAATFSMALFLYWRDEVDGIPTDIKRSHSPVMFDWVPSKVSTKTINGVIKCH